MNVTSKPVRLLLLLTLLLLPPLAHAVPAEAAAGRPNIVFILTDDMRLDDMRYMDYTRELFEQQGVTFTEALSPQPLCCPARANLVTGQYGQNNGVRHNSPRKPNGGYAGLIGKGNTLFRWLDDVGYKTAYIGKYLNGYKGGDIAGLDNNDASVGRTYAVNGVVSYNNGKPKRRNGHQTDFVTQRTQTLIRSYAQTSKPFLIWTGYLAPHTMKQGGKWGPPVPPAGYDTLDYDDAGMPDTVPEAYRDDMKARILSLYAVDDSVSRIVRTLKTQGEWSNTILVFASDNGYLLGEHDLSGKNKPYQESVRVPLMMAGPGITPATKVDQVVTLVDVPGTLARRADVSPGRTQDGRDLFTRPADRAVLIQAGSVSHPRGWTWQGVYTSRYTYTEWRTGETGFFDHKADPKESYNFGEDDPRAESLRAVMSRLKGCAGSQCQQTYTEPTG